MGHNAPRTGTLAFANRRESEGWLDNNVETTERHGIDFDKHWSAMIRSGDDFQGVTMSDDDVKKELERLRNENAALKKGAATGITMKVSEKGGLSVYGMGRFPITLYKEQWLKLLDMSDAIRAFSAAISRGSRARIEVIMPLGAASKAWRRATGSLSVITAARTVAW